MSFGDVSQTSGTRLLPADEDALIALGVKPKQSMGSLRNEMAARYNDQYFRAAGAAGEGGAGGEGIYAAGEGAGAAGGLKGAVKMYRRRRATKFLTGQAKGGFLQALMPLIPTIAPLISEGIKGLVSLFHKGQGEGGASRQVKGAVVAHLRRHAPVLKQMNKQLKTISHPKQLLGAMNGAAAQVVASTVPIIHPSVSGPVANKMAKAAVKGVMGRKFTRALRGKISYPKNPQTKSIQLQTPKGRAAYRVAKHFATKAMGEGAAAIYPQLKAQIAKREGKKMSRYPSKFASNPKKLQSRMARGGKINWGSIANFAKQALSKVIKIAAPHALNAVKDIVGQRAAIIPQLFGTAAQAPVAAPVPAAQAPAPAAAGFMMGRMKKAKKYKLKGPFSAYAKSALQPLPGSLKFEPRPPPTEFPGMERFFLYAPKPDPWGKSENKPLSAAAPAVPGKGRKKKAPRSKKVARKGYGGIYNLGL